MDRYSEVELAYSEKERKRPKLEIGEKHWCGGERLEDFSAKKCWCGKMSEQKVFEAQELCGQAWKDHNGAVEAQGKE